MKNTKHVAISMDAQQITNLNLLAERLNMPKSKIVNSLILITSKTDVLQDIIKTLSNFPAENNTIKRWWKLNREEIVQMWNEERETMIRALDNRINWEFNRSYEQERQAIQIARYRWATVDD